ncbi:MAG: glycoside hydrolase family 127 protein [Bacteroidetes bacterium]|jgi:DUF1680 family protein|nr:glycoside hydrolase family 127 protein [Bacteroidota bacterium]
MTIFRYALGIVVLIGVAGCAPQGTPHDAPSYPIEVVAHTDVRLSDAFWAERMATNRSVTLRHAFQQSERTGRLDNFRRAAGLESGAFCTTYPFDDTDLYKTLEGAAYTLSQHPDSSLEAQVDSIIALIAAAQEADGYLYPYGVLPAADEAARRRKEEWYGEQRWQKVHLHSHELYNAGHLYEAAVAHYEATGKRTLLDVAIKNAGLVARTFGPGPDQIQTIPGHPVIEMALARLYQRTGERGYLDLAAFFLDGRGDPRFGNEGGEYWQNHKPVKQQRRAVGHSVRAAYLYAGMSDVGMLAGDTALVEASTRLWEDVVRSKLYLIGGIGSTGDGEAFHGAYTLPNETAYNETCAAIAFVLWSHRLFRIHGEARYIDVVERALYNNVLAGVSLEGDRFFYPNPLASSGGYERSAWFPCACCVGNVARFIPTVPGYLYAVRGDTAYVNLFARSEADVHVAGQRVRFVQTTDYPWDGRVAIAVDPEQATRFTVKVRIPGWARERPVPSDLYRYVEAPAQAPVVTVNGETVPLTPDRGYAVLTRTWRAGDRITLEMPMLVRVVAAHDSVAANRGKVALERGPIVYAAEGVDNGGDVGELQLETSAAYEAAWQPDLLSGVMVVEGTAYDEGSAQALRAIPYYGWAHRDAGEMAVWLNRR